MSDRFYDNQSFITDDEYEEWLESDEFKRQDLENRIKNRIQASFVNWSISNYIDECIKKEVYSCSEHLQNKIEQKLTHKFYDIFEKEHKEAFDARVLTGADLVKVKETIEYFLGQAQQVLDPGLAAMEKRIDSLEQDLLDVVKIFTSNFNNTK